ncbi:MAG: hypothetical protein KatS3mg131_2715 [Candidatus Tectimicrobiota bacterium]|nr:MAG: hypothetical protein KatS3mg131_2715 [Candidatus Tectomicrobia bacterium]
MARLQDLPAYPVAVIAHPISDNTDEELRAKAEAAVEQCVAILCGQETGEGQACLG